MKTCFRRAWLIVAGALTLVALAPGRVLAQESNSASLAQELARLMSEAELDSIAAKDSREPDRFVAALYFPGQLLVVSARYEVPVYVEEKISNKDYREVYIDLNSAFVPESQTFVTDSGADGLHAQRAVDEAFDIFESPAGPVTFNGEWTTQQMSEADYMKAFSAADDQYARMLKALLAELR